ncbi:hypothetical protein GCM10023088_49050 [Actinomadura verrucosospora]|uniref:histidine kinase dimerization/phospho-acceptor domain-containing protein n=1 Tax=Actinomadura verrucosospora TaxID=46165 RepID=UPI0031E5BE17
MRQDIEFISARTTEVGKSFDADRRALFNGEAPAERQRRFAVQASHEMRTPLAALRLELEEALTNRDVADPFAALKEALQSVDRLENTVIALLWSLQRDASEHP